MSAAFGWAVLNPPDWGDVTPDIYSIAGSRAAAMERFIAGWRYPKHDGMSVSRVWKDAYRAGWRLARVSITPALGYANTPADREGS